MRKEEVVDIEEDVGKCKERTANLFYPSSRHEIVVYALIHGRTLLRRQGAVQLSYVDKVEFLRPHLLLRNIIHLQCTISQHPFRSRCCKIHTPDSGLGIYPPR